MAFSLPIGEAQAVRPCPGCGRGSEVHPREPVLWSFEEAELRSLFLDYHVMASGFNGLNNNNKYYSKGLPQWLSAKQSDYPCRRLGFDPWVGKKWQPLQYSPGDHKRVGNKLVTKNQQYITQHVQIPSFSYESYLIQDTEN